MLENTINEEETKPVQDIQRYFEPYIPQLAIDCVIFGFHDNELKVLLSKFPELDLWALQGGFIFKNEDKKVGFLKLCYYPKWDK